MTGFWKVSTVLALVLSGMAGSAGATGSANVVPFEVSRLPHGDHLNVRQWPSPRAPVVGELWSGDLGFVNLQDCWDARYDRRIPAHRVDFYAPNVWCGIRAGRHGRITGYVRTAFIHD